VFYKGIANIGIRVCELLLASLRAKKSKGLLRMIGKGATRGANLGSAGAMD
jgi:hypothetical protein